MLQRRLTYFLLLLTLIAAACASTGGGPPSDPNVLTQEELAEVAAGVLPPPASYLRPRWLQIRGARSINSSVQIAVFLNRTYLGDPDVLKSYHPKGVLRVRYLDGSTASASLTGFDSRHVEGAIVIETGTGRD